MIGTRLGDRSVKFPGSCWGCGEECYEVLRRDAAGRPGALGPMKECGTQIGMLLSDGSVCDLTFCRSCAGQLAPADYAGLWRAILAATETDLAGQSPNTIRERLGRLSGLWPLGPIYQRRLLLDGRIELDRRDG